nr:hypothetical protein [Desulfuromonadales bacterium]
MVISVDEPAAEASGELKDPGEDDRITTDYVLEGSVQASDTQVRVNVKLIETRTGNHVWAER